MTLINLIADTYVSGIIAPIFLVMAIILLITVIVPIVIILILSKSRKKNMQNKISIKHDRDANKTNAEQTASDNIEHYDTDK